MQVDFPLRKVSAQALRHGLPLRETAAQRLLHDFSLRKRPAQGLRQALPLRKMVPQRLLDDFWLRKRPPQGLWQDFPLREMAAQGLQHDFPLRKMAAHHRFRAGFWCLGEVFCNLSPEIFQEGVNATIPRP